MTTECKRLLDKVAVVTGAAQGIGFGLAERFAREGADVVLADMNRQGAEDAAAKLAESTDRRTLGLKVNVTAWDEVKSMVDTVVDQFGRIDVFVNNAGILKSHFIADFPEQDYDAVIAVNLKGTFLCCKAVAGQMVKQESGSIVNINSKSGKKGGLWNAAYCSSKFGAIGLTQSVALDLAPSGARVNAICPGDVLSTPLWDKLDKMYAKKLNKTPEQVRQTYIDKVPLGRETTVDDVAAMAVFLASDESTYITGQALNVSGGAVMW